MRYRFVYSQHAVAEALRVQRIAWRFLGALRLFLFTPARNKYGVAHARSRRTRGVTARKTISKEQTGGPVRRHRRHYRCFEHGSREVRRKTARPSATGAAAIRTSSGTSVGPKRPAASRAWLFSSRDGGDGRSWSHVRSSMAIDSTLTRNYLVSLAQ